MSKVAVHQFSAHLAASDAIGNELLTMQSLLQSAGYESRIFVADCDRDVRESCLRFREYDNYGHEDDIVVIHHSIGSEVIDYAIDLPLRKMLIYHNITPAKFFEDWNPNLRRVCEHGRKQLRLLAEQAELAFGDSEFNAMEVRNAGANEVDVLPILYDFSQLGERPSEVAKQGSGDWLHVGRVAPNKAVQDVIRSFALYKKYFRPEAKLYLAGIAHHGERYADACRRLVERLDVEGVIFTGRLARRKLNELYRQAAVLVCASEHEGFGVPFIEAMYCRLPIVAFNSTAVAETIGSAGVIYNDKDPLIVAALADKVCRDYDLKSALLAGADCELERFEPQLVGGKFLQAVARLAGETESNGAGN